MAPEAHRKTEPLATFETHGCSVAVWLIGARENTADAADAGASSVDALHAGGATADANPSGENAGAVGMSASNLVVYLHVYDGDGADVARACESVGCPPCTLVAIKPAGWNDDMTPWECPGLFAGDAPFSGHANRELAILESDIIPRVESALAPQSETASKTRPTRIIAGYSLAGLFALWAQARSAAFDRVASASGSLWYPGFARFVRESAMTRPPECAFVSLGKKETKTPSRLLRNVAQGTDEVVTALREKGIPTRFALNPGNHFKEPALRMARGIAWCASWPDVADADNASGGLGRASGID